jgi:hypothetical protein
MTIHHHHGATQLHDIFGGSYVPEQRADATHWNLPRAEVDTVIESLTASMFDEIMKSLRTALSLR